ncbi:hypothetical protein D9M71_345080 [compost metagenome]
MLKPEQTTFFIFRINRHDIAATVRAQREAALPPLRQEQVVQMQILIGTYVSIVGRAVTKVFTHGARTGQFASRITQ